MKKLSVWGSIAFAFVVSVVGGLTLARCTPVRPDRLLIGILAGATIMAAWVGLLVASLSRIRGAAQHGRRAARLTAIRAALLLTIPPTVMQAAAMLWAEPAPTRSSVVASVLTVFIGAVAGLLVFADRCPARHQR